MIQSIITTKTQNKTYKSGTNKIIKNQKLYNLKNKNKTYHKSHSQNLIINYNYKRIKYNYNKI